MSEGGANKITITYRWKKDEEGHFDPQEERVEYWPVAYQVIGSAVLLAFKPPEPDLMVPLDTIKCVEVRGEFQLERQMKRAELGLVLPQTKGPIT